MVSLVNESDHSPASNEHKSSWHMKIKVREFEAKELPVLRELMHELGYPLEKEELAANVKVIKERGGIIFIAEADGKIAGSIAAAISTGLAEGSYGEIISLVVFKDFRGKGVGKELVLKAEQWLKPRVKKIRVRANSIRLKAHEFYKALEYKEIKSQKSFMKKA